MQEKEEPLNAVVDLPKARTPFPAGFKFKREPRGKQLDVLQESWDAPYWAFLCRPGTGKTKLNLDTAAMNFVVDRIDALVVIAPDGVDRQWIDEGLPKDMAVPYVAGNYSARGTRIIAYRRLEALIATPRERGIIVLTMSFDGMQTPRAKKLLEKLQKTKRYMMVDDESHRTSNPKAAVYKAIKPWMRAARVKRIGTGTLLRQNPFSAWGQYELLGDGTLGFSSLASFKSMYAEMLPAHNPLVQFIAKDLDAKGRLRRDRNGNPIYPKIIAKGEDERPKYRNLGDLRRRIARVSSFLTLADVNGKEPVVNEDPLFVTLSDEQRTLYDDLVRWGVAQAPGGQLTAEGALALGTRLAQVAGGFVPSDDDPNAQAIGDHNPKIVTLLEKLEELSEEKVVVWCKFSAEIDAVAKALRDTYGDCVVEYHGRMNGKAKDQSKGLFIHERYKRFFVGQQKAGGTGLDGLQGVAHYMFFYSNDYPYLERLQAISRLARTDGADIVQVYDLIAQFTVDEDIVRCLKTAQDVSEAVLARAIVRAWE